nr:hypothetical protein BaRGS_004240 [Batillaria attramentaria]KAG5704301.1 hypothetical protein BaRGS_012610 [Batillaria attramentaria]
MWDYRHVGLLAHRTTEAPPLTVAEKPLRKLELRPSPGHMHELKLKEDSKIKAIEEKFTKLMNDYQIDGEFKIIGGKDTWHEIVNYQEKVGAIMIVVGSRGMNAIRRTFMGSVSDSIVHHAHVPVLVCRHH